MVNQDNGQSRQRHISTTSCHAATYLGSKILYATHTCAKYQARFNANNSGCDIEGAAYARLHVGQHTDLQHLLPLLANFPPHPASLFSLPIHHIPLHHEGLGEPFATVTCNLWAAEDEPAAPSEFAPPPLPIRTPQQQRFVHYNCVFVQTVLLTLMGHSFKIQLRGRDSGEYTTSHQVTVKYMPMSLLRIQEMGALEGSCWSAQWAAGDREVHLGIVFKYTSALLTRVQGMGALEGSCWGLKRKQVIVKYILACCS
eukprot:1159808-Pelagomonas_calceolata.AAC.3